MPATSVDASSASHSEFKTPACSCFQLSSTVTMCVGPRNCERNAKRVHFACSCRSRCVAATLRLPYLLSIECLILLASLKIILTNGGTEACALSSKSERFAFWCRTRTLTLRETLCSSSRLLSKMAPCRHLNH